ncbi:MAG: sigma-70 family RNA polymerase sigma factor [Clostridia bacterium]|nr:sigma-70 family RNA polymerase sigma factor [Clostridia bacterium]
MRKEAFIQCALEQERTLYRVAKTILRSDADCADAVQEALLKGLNHAAVLRNECYAKTWLTRILINTCKDMLRKEKRQPTVALSDYLPAEDRAEQRELYEALQALEEKWRLPLVLHYLEGFSIREIAQMLRVPEGTVKRRLWQARKEMKAMLTEEAI